MTANSTPNFPTGVSPAPATLPVPPAVPFTSVHWDWAALHTPPNVHPTAWIAPGAVVYGRVAIGARSSVWFGAIIRGDHEQITIGEDTNVQDQSVLHVDPGQPCRLGNRVTLGHRALVHGAVVEDDALIGISACVLSRAVIGAGALIAAGAVVLEGTVVPPGTLWAGCPARQIRELSPEQQARIKRTYQHYVNNSIAHRAWLSETAAKAPDPPADGPSGLHPVTDADVAAATAATYFITNSHLNG